MTGLPALYIFLVCREAKGPKFRLLVKLSCSICLPTSYIMQACPEASGAQARLSGISLSFSVRREVLFGSSSNRSHKVVRNKGPCEKCDSFMSVYA